LNRPYPLSCVVAAFAGALFGTTNAIAQTNRTIAFERFGVYLATVMYADVIFDTECGPFLPRLSDIDEALARERPHLTQPEREFMDQWIIGAEFRALQRQAAVEAIDYVREQRGFLAQRGVTDLGVACGYAYGLRMGPVASSFIEWRAAAGALGAP